MSDKPHRIQLKRTKGWRLPPNTVIVDRRTKWGNPFDEYDKARCVANYRVWLSCKTVNRWPCMTGKRTGLLASIDELRGKNLACWCKPGAPCHADVLLELANREAN